MSYTIPEIIVLSVIIPILLASLVAFLNIDWLNGKLLQFHKWVEKSHAETKSNFKRFFIAVFKYPGDITKSIHHEGWKSGVIVLSSAFSITGLFAIIAAMLFVAYIVAIIAFFLIIIVIVLEALVDL